MDILIFIHFGGIGAIVTILAWLASRIGGLAPRTAYPLRKHIRQPA